MVSHGDSLLVHNVQMSSVCWPGDAGRARRSGSDHAGAAAKPAVLSLVAPQPLARHPAICSPTYLTHSHAMLNTVAACPQLQPPSL